MNGEPMMLAQSFDLSHWLDDDSPHTGMDLTLFCKGTRSYVTTPGHPDNWFEAESWDVILKIRSERGYVELGELSVDEAGVHTLLAKTAPGYTQGAVEAMLSSTIVEGHSVVL